MVARQLLEAAGAKEQAPAAGIEAAEIRSKIYTQFINCYDQIRRVVTYVRWDADDIDDFAPSLFAGRGGSARKSPAAEPELDETEVPAKAAETAASHADNDAKIPVGMPGASPFING